MAHDEVNWSANYAYRAPKIARPRTAGEVQELVTAATDASPVRALGTRHTFNDVADPGDSGTLVNLAELPAKIEIDAERRVVTVAGGLRYGDLALALAAEGWALHNLASLPHISVAGAVATATHGSGSRNGNLSSVVAALTFVDGSGSLVTLRRGDADFDGAVVAFGSLGIVTELELDIVPTFEIAQTIYLGVPYERVSEALDLAYSVSVFTDWSPSSINQLWVKAAVAAPSVEASVRELGATPALHKVHMIAAADAAATTEQFGVAGSWHERLAHFKLDFQPSAGEEIQTEYLLPRRHAQAAVAAVRELTANVTPLLLISELRAIAADGLWLSTAYSSGDDEWADGAIAFHFTWKREQAAVETASALLEATLARFGARPHWGKVYTDAARIPALYPRFADFAALVQKYDPRGVFRNAYTRRLGL
ncbi:FAD-binding protein [Gryllotalpicola protaetiae]|uniref:FAD-binding protein n=1 Tax=Gryllotalpicola protaetiae TaxID=2419771 RepID=A0A387BNA0_9MICO|nr:FAD-binding protein [Gryllotalpicola protaetiae]AYG05303.1 FAD-binding protein [Gryllotalpicola protaetiae]